MPSALTFTRLSRTLAAACVLAVAAPQVSADEPSAFAGLLRAESPKDGTLVHPLPAKYMASARKNWGAFLITNVTTNETFNMPIYPHYPVAAGVQPALLATLENDGKNFIVPLDLTGRGVADLLVGRQDWGGWRVYTNGELLSKPVDGFVEGFYPKGEETMKSQLLAMDLSDLQVDNNLMGVAGDFMGNGTEQLAYFRPGWGAIQLAGAHGKISLEADLSGIPADKEGDRCHWLFAFKGSKPGERTRFAYYRKGATQLLIFTNDGSRFTRTVEDTATHWKLLNQFNPNPL